MDRPSLCVVFFTLLVAGICIAGCTTPSAPGAGAASPSLTAQPAPGVVTDARLNETIARFDPVAEQLRQRWNVPGMAVAIVKDGKMVFAKGYGMKVVGGTDPVTPDTVFQIGSTSKAFTAALVAREVDRGRMHWDDPVIRYVGDFRMYSPEVTKNFTLTDSLAQWSGLYERWGQDLTTLGYSRSEMIHALRYAEPVAGFRSEYRYQNIPFVVAAAAVENTSGMRWEENLRQEIFLPLGMKSATTGYDAFRSAPDHAELHMIGENPDGSFSPVRMDPDWQFNDFIDYMGPAGGINANVRDMAAWTIFQLGNGTFDGTRLMSEENLAYIHKPQILIPDESTPDSKSYYCQGWIYQTMNGTPAVVRHTGETLGHHAYVLFVPEENLGIVVLANEAGPMLPDEVGMRFYRMYYDIPPQAGDEIPVQAVTAFLFPAQPARPENPSPPLPAAWYTGTYTNPYYGTATVTEKGGNLSLTFGKNPVTFHLSPWDGNTFRSTCPQWTWMQAYNGRVTFETGPDGTVRELTTSLLLQKILNQNATFVRTGTSGSTVKGPGVKIGEGVGEV